MQQYVGTKVVMAEPDRRSGKPGYKVVYQDGYESWSPQEVFEESYRRTDNMSFGLALESMKRGLPVARAGWNGKGMWLMLVTSADYNVTKSEALGRVKLPWIGMKTADGGFVPWLASQTDMLADDWTIVGAIVGAEVFA